MALTLKEAIQSQKLKLIAKELEPLARQDRSVKKIVDQLKAGKEPKPSDITALKGDTQDEVVMAFASVIGPMKTTKFLEEEKGPCWDGYKQVGTKKKNGKEVPNCVPEGKEDSDIGDREGSQPASYHKGLAKSTKEKRDAQFKKQAQMSDDDPNAYKPAPGDKRAETKPSQHTKKFDKMFGEHVEELEEQNVEKALKNKSEKTGVAYGILKQVYDRGVAAWRTGHRPGTTPSQWGLARVNSFVTGGTTQKTTDKDLWAKHKGKNEEVELDEAAYKIPKNYASMMMKKNKNTGTPNVRVDAARYVRSHKSKPKGRGRWSFTTKPMGTPKDNEVFNMPYGDYEQAKKQAQQWAEKKGSSVVYVMESVELDEAVRVDKKKYSWGQMITVHDGKANSFPLHPEHQRKIKSLRDGQRVVFQDETGALVTAHRKGDQIHLSNKMSSRKVPVDYSVFTESVDLTEAKFGIGDPVQVKDKPKNVVDKQFFGKAGFISGKAGRDFMVKFPNSRSIIVDAEDLELMKEELKYMYSEANHSPMHVAKAVRVAKDMGGDMTGAVEKIEKMAKGLSDHPKVKAALRMANEEFVAEKAESQAQAIAARIALKHKREGTKPEAGTASAEMMKMSEKDLEDFTKAKKGAPEKVSENIEDKMPASPDEKSMALKQADFIQYVGREIGEHLVANKEFPEWMQNKLSALHQKAKDMHATLGAHGGDMDETTSVTNYSPKSQGGTRKELIAKYRRTKNPKDAEAARKAGATQKELQGVAEEVDLDEEQKLFMFKTKAEAQKKAKEIQGKVLELGPKNFAVVTKELTIVREAVKLDESKKIPPAQLDRLRKAYGSIDTMNVTGPAYKKLQKFLDGLDQEELKAFADADIRWLSRMAKRRLKEGVNEEVELHENFIRNLRQVAQRLGLRDIAWKLLDMEKDKAAEKITQSDIDGFVKDAEEAYPMIKTTYQRYYKGLINKLKKAKGREALDMMQEIARYISKIQSTAKMRNEEVELTESHYKVGQKVECIKSGMKGTVIHVDPSDTGKYYTVKRDDGKEMTFAPDELKPVGEVKEAMDPVDKEALKKKFAKRKDKDIDNDGDVDSSDEYLHKRRSTIAKAIAKEQSEVKLKEKDVDMDGDADDLDKSLKQRKQKVLDTSE